MKVVLIIITTILPAFLTAQTVYESLMSMDRTYAPLFGSQKSSLAIDLIRTYDLEGSDTTYHTMVKVNQTISEAVGYSVGLSLFSSRFTSGSAVSGGASYVYQKENGIIIMGFDEFDALYNAINKTYTYISKVKQIKGSKRNSIVTYKVRDITFGGEYNPGSLNYVKYYIQVGEAVFTVDEVNFIEIATVLRNMKQAWENSQS